MDKQKEIDFLKGYVTFSPNARTLQATILWERAKNLEPGEERELLYLLAIESFFMQQETLYKFLIATKKATSGNTGVYLNSLVTTDFNPLQSTMNIKSTSDLNIVYPEDITEEEKQKIDTQLNGIIKVCKDLANANKKMSYIYYALKHGFLVYKNEEGIFGLFHPEKEAQLEEYFKSLDIKPDKDSLAKNDFSYIIDMNKRIECAIQDLVALRLLQLGINKI